MYVIVQLTWVVINKCDQQVVSGRALCVWLFCGRESGPAQRQETQKESDWSVVVVKMLMSEFGVLPTKRVFSKIRWYCLRYIVCGETWQPFLLISYSYDIAAHEARVAALLTHTQVAVLFSIQGEE